MAKMKRMSRPPKGNPNIADYATHRWKKGQSGNPNGAPIGMKTLTKSMAGQLGNLVIDSTPRLIKLCEELGKDPASTILKDLLALIHDEEAIIHPNSRAADRLFDRVDGTIVQSHNIKSDAKISSNEKHEIDVEGLSVTGLDKIVRTLHKIDKHASN